MTRQFTTEELADRWFDKRDVLNLAGKYVTSILLKKEGEVFDAFWAQDEDVCLCFHDSYYKGQAAVSGYYQAVSHNTEVKSALLKKMFPAQLEELSDAEVFGVGQLRSLPITTPVIEIAADRKTAKGIWHIEGSNNDISVKGPLSYWSIGFLCIDFIREEDDWKLWHVFFAEDIACPMGQNWAAPQEPEDNPDFAALADCVLPPYTGTGTFYVPYRADRPFTPPPKLPEPYETFAETFSYGV